MTDERIPVLVNGALGQMGREVIKVVASAEDMVLAGAVDLARSGEDVGEVLGLGSLGVVLSDDLQGQLMLLTQRSGSAVMVDFTHPSSVYENVRSAIAYGIRPVVGTTGLSSDQIKALTEFADKASIGGLIAPNFSVGMVLLQQFSIQAAQYFDHVEIIELHHNRKADAPSGTAVKTAEMIAQSIKKAFNVPTVEETEVISGARGGQAHQGIRLHSLRLPGLVAHQQVIFGGLGQTLTLQHDTTDRVAYMPGVLLGIRKAVQLDTLVYGLETILS